MRELQKKVEDFNKKNKLKSSPEIDALDLVSEVGEVAKEILKMSDYGKKKPKYRKEIKNEIGDVFYSLIKLSNHYKINLDEALVLVLKKYEDRICKKSNPSSEN